MAEKIMKTESKDIVTKERLAELLDKMELTALQTTTARILLRTKGREAMVNYLQTLKRNNRNHRERNMKDIDIQKAKAQLSPSGGNGTDG